MTEIEDGMGDEIERLRNENAVLRDAIKRFVPGGLHEKALCMHEGYSFKKHGRCCFKCGAFMVDFGD